MLVFPLWSSIFCFFFLPDSIYPWTAIYWHLRVRVLRHRWRCSPRICRRHLGAFSLQCFVCRWWYMNLYIYVYTYIIIHAYIYIYMRILTYTCTYFEKYTYMYLCIYIDIYVITHIYIYIHTYAYKYIYRYTDIECRWFRIQQETVCHDSPGSLLNVWNCRGMWI